MILKLIDKDLVFINPPVKSKEDLFEFFADRAFKKGLVESAEEFGYGLVDREAQGSTELKPGIAIPHAKLDVVKQPFLIIATFKTPIRFSPGFGKGVEIIILIGSPKMDNTYINILASVARLMDKENFIKDIKGANVPEDIILAIKKYSIADASYEKGKTRYLLSLTLNNKFSIKSVLGLLLEVGIQQPYMFSGENLAIKESFGIPIFRISSIDLKSTVKDSKIIHGITEDKEASIKLYNALKTEGINLDDPGVGSLFLMKLENCFGGINPDIDF
jgi:mannitol/fructose-specific phosphotransferase system IIA component (Ntr-type)